MTHGRASGGLARGLAALCIYALIASGAVGRPSQRTAPVKPKPPAEALQHEVTVTLKLIQVFVTDASGKPALDLQKSDFVLHDNGVPQTITDFEKHAEGLPALERPAPAPSGPPAAAPLLSRKFFFIIDYIRNDRKGVLKSRDAVLDFMATKIRPEDEIALYTLSSMSGLTQHEYLTKDHDKIRGKLKKLWDVVGGGQERPLNYLPLPPPPVSPQPQQAGDSFELKGKGLLDSDVFAAAVDGHAGSDVRHQFSQIAAWATALASIPGQKNIVLFTRGFGSGVFNPGSATHPLFQTMVRQLASADAPVFSIDTNTGPGVSTTEASLDHLSRATGGQYFQNVRDYARIAAGIQTATANYYVLGYAIPAAWDGKYHKVKVEVNEPGYVVHVQSGYFDPLPYDKLSPIMKHLHLLNAVLGEAASSARALDFPVTALSFTRTGGAGNILFLSELAVESIRAAVGDRTEFITLVLDENSTIVDGRRAEIDWKSLKAETIYQYGVAALAPGRYDCRTVVRNLDDGRTAVGSCVVEVAAPLAEGPLMSAPLLLVRGAEGRYLNLASPEEGAGEEDLSLSRIFPFPAKEYIPLVGPLEQGTTSLFATLRCVWREERRANGEIDLSTWLTHEGSEEREPVEMSLLETTSRDEADFYFLELVLPALSPGRYRLEIRAEETGKGSVVSAAGWLTVR
jgi:VWFA-related protein